jgi:hypothetical protein
MSSSSSSLKQIIGRGKYHGSKQEGRLSAAGGRGQVKSKNRHVGLG